MKKQILIISYGFTLLLQFVGCATIPGDKKDVMTKPYENPAIEVPKVYDYGRCVQANDEVSGKINKFYSTDSTMLSIKVQSSILTCKAKKESRKTIIKNSLAGGLFGMLFCDFFWLLAPDKTPNGKFFAVASPITFAIMSLVAMPIMLYNDAGTNISYGLQKEYYQLLIRYNDEVTSKINDEKAVQDSVSKSSNE